VSYIPRYTTLESIQSKLQSRLAFMGGGFGGNNPMLISQDVNDLFFTEILEEAEDLLDIYLRLVYVVPLAFEHPILRKIVDNLTIADLLVAHFPHAGMDANSPIVAALRMDAYQFIRCLTYPLPVAIPGLPLEPKERMHIQAILLPGETQIQGQRPNIGINANTVIGTRRLDPKIIDFDDPFNSHNRQLGQEMPL
jgi:hypothetical protein